LRLDKTDLNCYTLGYKVSPETFFNPKPMSLAERLFRGAPVATLDSGVISPGAPNHITTGLDQKASGVIVEIKDTGSISPAFAANVAINSAIILDGSSRVHSPIPRRKQHNLRTLLATYDSIAQGQQIANHMGSEAQAMTATVGPKKAEIEKASADWDAVHARHAVLRAIKPVAQEGKFYLDLLYQRTGLTHEAVKLLREAIPSWKETEQVLTPDQRVTAEAVCARLLIRKCHEVASAEAKSQGESGNKDLVSQKTVQLLQAHIRVQQQQDGATPQEEQANSQAIQMLPELEMGRNKIFDRAQLWNGRERKLKVRAVAKEFHKVDSDAALQEIAGITPDMVAEAKKGKLREWTKTGMLALGNESLSHLPGFAAVVPAAQIQEQLAQSPWLLAIGTAALYGGMAGAIIRNSFLSADLIAETGVGLDPAGKAKFDSAIENERMEAVTASLKYHAAWEMPFYGLAAVIGVRYGWEAGLAYFNAASVAGLAKNSLVNSALEVRKVISKKLESRKRRKAQAIYVRPTSN
jgi:hypothetical protein